MRVILTFHSIDPSGSVLSYPAPTFARLLGALARSDFSVMDLDTLLLPGTKRGVVVTFDDGIRTIYTAALPILKDHGVPAHLFLTTGTVGGDNRWPSQPAAAASLKMLAWSEIEALHAAGIHIEAHTANHPDLRALDDAAAAAECEGADEAIASRLGRRPRFFAYPYGYSNERVRALARARYRASVTTQLRYLHGNEDPAALPRLDSYYLRSERLFRNLRAPQSRGYLALRGLLRQLRGRQ